MHAHTPCYATNNILTHHCCCFVYFFCIRVLLPVPRKKNPMYLHSQQIKSFVLLLSEWFYLIYYSTHFPGNIMHLHTIPLSLQPHTGIMRQKTHTTIF